MSTFEYIDIDQGSDFYIDVIIDNDNNPNNAGFDLDDFVARCQFRQHYNSSKFYTVDADIIDAQEGRIRLSLSAEDSRQIPSGRYVYDVEVSNQSDGVRFRVLEGILTLSPSVTR